MCTSIALKTNDFYFGRNLDLEYAFGEQVAVTPRHYPIVFRKAGEMTEHYAMIGMANIADGYPLYAEAVNEKGLCIAGLNFPENAYYPPELAADKANISPFELPLWLLGQCANVAQARDLLTKTKLVGIHFSERMPLSPLHWHIADENESIVLEATVQGMQIYDNPANVLTNNPPFEFHMANLNQYMHLSPRNQQNSFAGDVPLRTFGQGMGAIGLPGDFSPASRFVKAAFLRANSLCEKDEESSVTQFFHLLDAVAMPSGAVITPEGRADITTYSCCVNASKGVYYYKTYSNNQITAVDMHAENPDGVAVKAFPLVKAQQIHWQNRA